MSRFANILDLPPGLREQVERKLNVRTIKGRDTVDDPEKKPERKRNKYNAQKVRAYGANGKRYQFDSKHEYAEYLKLAARERAGEIQGLEVHVKFALFDPGAECRGRDMGSYTCDFTYKENGQRIVADAKGAATRALRDWRRTRDLMRACHGYDVIEL